MRLASPLAIAALAAALLAGCGGPSAEGGSTSRGPVEHEAQVPAGSGAPVGASAKSCDSGGADAEGLRAAGVSCGQARQVMHGWQRDRACAAPSGASRTACSSRSYRCLGARTDRGVAVSCSRPGRSIAFLATKP